MSSLSMSASSHSPSLSQLQRSFAERLEEDKEEVSAVIIEGTLARDLKVLEPFGVAKLSRNAATACASVSVDF